MIFSGCPSNLSLILKLDIRTYLHKETVLQIECTDQVHEQDHAYDDSDFKDNTQLA